MLAEERQYILDNKTDFFIRESYNTLRSNVTFSLPGGGCKVIEVTSTIAGEGKSINALNLAISFSEIDKKVLLVDCDLRKPKVHRLIGETAAPGLSNLLVGDCTTEEATRTKFEHGVDIICSGNIPPNSTQMLESEMMHDFLETVKEKYDFVILDMPPVNIVIDGCVLAKDIDGVVFVVRENFAKKEAVSSAVRQVEFAGGKILGFVFNDVTDRSFNPFSKYGSYRYKYNYRNGYRYKYKYNTKYGDETGSSSGKDTKLVEKKKVGKVRGNKVLKRIGQVAAAVLLVVIAVGAYLAAANREWISIWLNTRNTTPEEIAVKQSENDAKTSALLGSITTTEITELDDETRAKLGSGELSQSEAVAIILGYNPEEKAATAKARKLSDEEKSLISSGTISEEQFVGIASDARNVPYDTVLERFENQLSEERQKDVLAGKVDPEEAVTEVAGEAYNALSGMEIISMPSEETLAKISSGGMRTKDEVIKIVTEMTGVGEAEMNGRFDQLTEAQKKDILSGKTELSEIVDLLGGGTGKSATRQQELAAAKDTVIANIYILKAEFATKIDALVEEARGEYWAMPASKRKNFDNLIPLINKVTERGNALENECNSRMNSLLAELRAILDESGESTAIISEIEERYKAEKRLKKEEMFSKYYPG